MIFAVVLILGILFLIFPKSNTSFVALEKFEGEVTLYKSMSCGCCGVHSNYLSSKGGLDIDIIEMMDLTEIKNQYNISPEFQSCHTAVIGNYFVEGHMPLEAIEKLLAEEPDIAGISLPSMPSGSPGMPGTKYGDFVIYGINHDGSSYEFMRI